MQLNWRMPGLNAAGKESKGMSHETSAWTLYNEEWTSSSFKSLFLLWSKRNYSSAKKGKHQHYTLDFQTYSGYNTRAYKRDGILDPTSVLPGRLARTAWRKRKGPTTTWLAGWICGMRQILLQVNFLKPLSLKKIPNNLYGFFCFKPDTNKKEA